MPWKVNGKIPRPLFGVEKDFHRIPKNFPSMGLVQQAPPEDDGCSRARDGLPFAGGNPCIEVNDRGDSRQKDRDLSNSIVHGNKLANTHLSFEEAGP
jgi:hypothetical protein